MVVIRPYPKGGPITRVKITTGFDMNDDSIDGRIQLEGRFHPSITCSEYSGGVTSRSPIRLPSSPRQFWFWVKIQSLFSKDFDPRVASIRKLSMIPEDRPCIWAKSAQGREDEDEG